MAKRKRRRPHLGAPPESHRARIPDEGRRAEELARSAVVDGEHGFCRSALSMLKLAVHAHGSMFTHITSLEGRERAAYDPSYQRAADLIERTADFIDKQCSKRPGRWQ